jgi:hypothetical protein
MAFFTNPGAETQELFSGELLQEQVRNRYDWGRLNQGSPFHALLANVRVGSLAETSYMINNEYDFPHKMTLDSAQTTFIPALNAESPVFIDLNAKFVESSLNGSFQVGDCFQVRGEADGTEAGRTDADQIEALVRISEVNGSGHVKWVTLDITADNNSALTTGATLDTGATTNATFLLTKCDEYSGDSPNPISLYTDYNYNFMQMIRMPFIKSKINTTTTYDNSLEYLGLNVMDQLMMAIERQIVFSKNGRPADATTDVSRSTIGGTGADYGTTNGLAGYMGLHNLAATTNRTIQQIEAGTTVDFWDLRDWAVKFDKGGVKWALTSPSFANLLAKTALEFGAKWQPMSVQFPQFKLDYIQYDLGVVKINVITSRQLEYASPIVVGSDSGGTARTAAHKNFLLAIDPSYIELLYHQSKMGIMAPSFHDVMIANNPHSDKKEAKACFSLSMWNQSAHGVFGITGA